MSHAVRRRAATPRGQSLPSNFRRWWAEHRVAERDFGAKVMIHPTAGRMRLNRDSFTYADAAWQQLILWSADAGSPDADALSTLVPASRQHGSAPEELDRGRR